MGSYIQNYTNFARFIFLLDSQCYPIGVMGIARLWLHLLVFIDQ